MHCTLNFLKSLEEHVGELPQWTAFSAPHFVNKFLHTVFTD